MTYKCAEYFGNLDNEYLECKLQDFAKKFGAKHTPSVVAVKAIASRLAMKQRQRVGFDLEVTNESKAQLVDKTGWSEGTCGDVIKFLEWMGLVKTIRRGGGKNKMPTVRHMITTGPPIRFQNKHDGIIYVRNGRTKKQNGITDDQDGEFPDTPKELPIGLPREREHDVYVHESFTNKINKQISEKEKSKHKPTRVHLDACEDKIDYLEELSSLAEENSHYLSLLLEINDPTLGEELMARLSGDLNLDALEDAFNFDVTDDLDEYSVTPDDVRDLMTHW